LNKTIYFVWLLTNNELTFSKKLWFELGEISCSKLNNFFITRKSWIFSTPLRMMHFIH